MKKELTTWAFCSLLGGIFYVKSVASLWAWSWVLAIPTALILGVTVVILFALSIAALFETHRHR